MMWEGGNGIPRLTNVTLAPCSLVLDTVPLCPSLEDQVPVLSQDPLYTKSLEESSIILIGICYHVRADTKKAASVISFRSTSAQLKLQHVVDGSRGGRERVESAQCYRVTSYSVQRGQGGKGWTRAIQFSETSG